MPITDNKSSVEDSIALTNRMMVDSKDEGEVLEMMGYRQETLRNFSVLSLLGMGFALTNSWWAISASMVVGLPSGGTVGIVYGLIILFIASLGPVLLDNATRSSKVKTILAYICGYLSWAGAIFTSVSVALAVAQGIVGMVQLSHPDLVIDRWMIFLTSELLNLAVMFFNFYSSFLPVMASTALYVTLAGFVVSFITVLGCSSDNYNGSKFVFAQFINETGWSNNGIAFIVGLINPSWAFPCLDAATHLAEEVVRPERAIPIAIMGTVLIGFVTSFSYVIGMFFSVRDLAALSSTATGVPILELFSQVVKNKGAAIFLEVMVTCSGIGTLISSHTWQSRICWSFSRDHGVPASVFFSKINQTTMVPLNAHLLSVFITAVLLCLYMASLTAFNSMVSACVVFLYLSYVIPTVCLLTRGRSRLAKGPFFLGRWGAVANYGTLIWVSFTTVFFSFPYAKPVSAGNMNYLSVVLAIMVLYVIGYWIFVARKHFVVHALDHA